MTKHTPGPWKKDGLDWIGSDGNKVVVNDGPAFGSKTHFPNAEANSRLIKAAPETAAERDRLKEINAELLAALEMCTKSMSSVLPDFNSYDRAAYDKARTVIAKAKGEL